MKKRKERVVDFLSRRKPETLKEYDSFYSLNL